MGSMVEDMAERLEMSVNIPEETVMIWTYKYVLTVRRP